MKHIEISISFWTEKWKPSEIFQKIYIQDSDPTLAYVWKPHFRLSQFSFTMILLKSLKYQYIGINPASQAVFESVLCFLSCSVIGIRIGLKLSTYPHVLMTEGDCSAAIPKPKWKKKYSYFEVISLEIEKVLGKNVFFLLLNDNCKKAGFRREETEQSESFFQILPHRKFPCPFSWAYSFLSLYTLW